MMTSAATTRTATPQSPQLEGPILFFDGECGLCARSIRWSLRHDRRKILRFAPLQGETYAHLNIPAKPTDLSTSVLLEGGALSTQSDAWLGTLRALGGEWGVIAAVARFIPRFVRDAAYRFIARRRLAWFGPADACARPADADLARFLP